MKYILSILLLVCALSVSAQQQKTAAEQTAVKQLQEQIEAVVKQNEALRAELDSVKKENYRLGKSNDSIISTVDTKLNSFAQNYKVDWSWHIAFIDLAVGSVALIFAALAIYQAISLLVLNRRVRKTNDKLNLYECEIKEMSKLSYEQRMNNIELYRAASHIYLSFATQINNVDEPNRFVSKITYFLKTIECQLKCNRYEIDKLMKYVKELTSTRICEKKVDKGRIEEFCTVVTIIREHLRDLEDKELYVKLYNSIEPVLTMAEEKINSITSIE